jgi:hypothetical protein
MSIHCTVLVSLLRHRHYAKNSCKLVDIKKKAKERRKKGEKKAEKRRKKRRKLRISIIV